MQKSISADFKKTIFGKQACSCTKMGDFLLYIRETKISHFANTDFIK